mgnify:CR=1 FL=1
MDMFECLKIDALFRSMNGILKLSMVAAIISLASCTYEPAEVESPKEEAERQQEQPGMNGSFVQDTVLLTEEFSKFTDPKVPEVLESLGLCVQQEDTSALLLCHDQLFRIFPSQPDKTWESGFIIDVRPQVIPGSVTRRVFVVEPVDGAYKIVNDLRGSLLELRTTKEGRYEFIARFYDSGIGKVAVLFQWDEEHHSYLPQTVAEINDYFVNPEKVDSLNEVYLNDFAWGY